MEELGVIDEVQADQFDCFVGQCVPHLESKTSRLHHFDNDRDKGSAASHGSSISLKEAHVRSKEWVSRIVGRRVTEGSANEVCHGLNGINH